MSPTQPASAKRPTYRHFTGNDELAREIFVSWYGWYCGELQRIVNGSAAALDREIVRHEFSAATEHSEAFVYFCENEARFAPALQPEMLSARRAGVHHGPMVFDFRFPSSNCNLTRFKSRR
jgi:hypothetical protein